MLCAYLLYALQHRTEPDEGLVELLVEDLLAKQPRLFRAMDEFLIERGYLEGKPTISPDFGPGAGNR